MRTLVAIVSSVFLLTACVTSEKMFLNHDPNAARIAAGAFGARDSAGKFFSVTAEMKGDKLFLTVADNNDGDKETDEYFVEPLNIKKDGYTYYAVSYAPGEDGFVSGVVRRYDATERLEYIDGGQYPQIDNRAAAMKRLRAIAAWQRDNCTFIDASPTGLKFPKIECAKPFADGERVFWLIFQRAG